MEEVVPLLVVDDVPAAIDYYVHTLGFTVNFAFPLDSPVFAVVKRHKLKIMLEAAESYAAKMGAGCQPGPRGIGVDLNFVIADPIDDYYETITQAGVTPIRPIFTTGYGMRQFTIRDPGGYVLTFIQAESRQAPSGE